MNAPTIEQLDAAHEVAKKAAEEANMFLISAAYAAWQAADNAFQSLQSLLLSGRLTAMDTVTGFISQKNGSVVYIQGLPPCETYHKMGSFFAILVWANTVETEKEVDTVRFLEGFSARRGEEEKIGLNGLIQLLTQYAIPRGWVEENQQRFERATCMRWARIGTEVLTCMEKEYHHVRGLLEEHPADAPGQLRLPLNTEPELVTKRQIHEMAVKLSPSSAQTLKTFQNAQLPGFKDVEGRRQKVADFQELLPHLKEKWPEIPWPPHVSDWE